MKLARKPHKAGAKIRYEISYSNWLADGDTLSTVSGDCTVGLAPDSTVIDVIVDQLQVASDHLYFFVSGGSVSEVFTVQVSIKTTRGEIEPDTIEFFVTKP